MRTKRYIFQIKGQNKSPEKKNETEISDYLKKIFQLMFINMLLKLKSRMEDHNENINK